MQTIDGRVYATRAELSERAGYKGDATLRDLWADREDNGHPPALRIGRALYWDVRGSPDEELPPAGQAKVLGISVSAISRYRDNLRPVAHPRAHRGVGERPGARVPHPAPTVGVSRLRPAGRNGQPPAGEGAGPPRVALAVEALLRV
jgi:hypothetical protein